jgi:hypothetical protein
MFTDECSGGITWLNTYRSRRYTFDRFLCRRWPLPNTTNCFQCRCHCLAIEIWDRVDKRINNTIWKTKILFEWKKMLTIITRATIAVVSDDDDDTCLPRVTLEKRREENEGGDIQVSFTLPTTSFSSSLRFNFPPNKFATCLCDEESKTSSQPRE